MADIVDKIRKLRAMAEGSTNEAEAASFADKVQKMLLEHNLTTDDIETVEDDKIAEEDFGEKYIDPWRRCLAGAVARFYMCEFCNDHVWDGKNYHKSFTIIGKAHNRAVAISMYHYLTTTTVRLAKEYATKTAKDYLAELRELKDFGYTPEEAVATLGEVPTPRAAALGFERGCGERLATRLNLKRKELTKQPKQPLPALMISESKEVEVWVENNMDLVPSKGLRGSNVNSHGVAGAKAANSVGLSEQVGSSKSEGRLLS